MSGMGPTAGPATAPAPAIVADASWSLNHPGPATNATTNIFFTLVLTGQDAVVRFPCPDSCRSEVPIHCCISSQASLVAMWAAPVSQERLF